MPTSSQRRTLPSLAPAPQIRTTPLWKTPHTRGRIEPSVVATATDKTLPRTY